MPLPPNPNDADHTVPISKDGECSRHAYDAEISDGAFAATHGAFSRTFILCTITDDTRDFDDISIELDPADLADADALEDLIYGSSNTSAHDQLAVDETPVDLMVQPDETEVGDQGDMADLVSASAVVIESFPFGMPGAPIPGRAQGPSVYDSHAALMGSPWAPFRSQLDWDVAHWVKRRGPSSTAVSELLGIPGVRVSNFLYSVSNLVVIGR